MKLLILSDQHADLIDLLQSCNAEIEQMTLEQAVNRDIAPYDAYCVLGGGQVLDARVREKLEAAADAGKHVFVEAVNSFRGMYSADPVGTVRSRLIYVEPDEGGVPGLTTGDILDDEANSMMQPYWLTDEYRPILVYKEHIIAHAHLDAPADEILKDSRCGLWMLGDSVMMTSFRLSNYNRARFAPRGAWEKLIAYITEWLTGSRPSRTLRPVLTFGVKDDLADEQTFERCRKEAIVRGMNWLERFLVDQGRGGIREGLNHNIDPDGRQTIARVVRTDCCGEAAGAFKMYARLFGEQRCRTIGEDLDRFTYGPMQIHDGPFAGMLRWTAQAWQVCYQDDAARTVLSGLYDCLYMGSDATYPAICRALDFLVKTTAQDGCRVARTDLPDMTEANMRELAQAPSGLTSAHYNAYYHAALLLAYQHGRNPEYLAVARKGLETLMALYPDTRREQSETQELCRLVLPLAALYQATGEEAHRSMLYRVVTDLQAHRHPSGGYREWDTGYKAACSRESTGECSLLTQNGDPVADLLYSVNWLPIGFAYAYHVTRDEWFRGLWRDIVAFMLKAQVHSDDPLTDGSWCRGFDMDLGEAYGCPHDVGWAVNASESGWTNAQILMGMMMPDILR